MEKSKLVICGSRTIVDYSLVKKNLDRIITDKTSVIIISGGAKGVDQLAEKYAKDNNIELVVVKAEWDKHGKKAGILRNIEMIDMSDQVICFWNGMSKGTNHSIDYAKKNNKLKEIIYIK